MHPVRRRFWVAAVASATSVAILPLTIAVPDWIEGVFGVDPDHGDESLEWAIVAVLVTVALAATIVAAGEWLRRRVGGDAPVADERVG
jgi:hypothetical protein